MLPLENVNAKSKIGNSQSKIGNRQIKEGC